MKFSRKLWLGLLAGVAALTAVSSDALAQQQAKRPNIILLMNDDTGWYDLGVYGGGANLGHPTPAFMSTRPSDSIKSF
jgi:hypothetical protein